MMKKFQKHGKYQKLLEDANCSNPSITKGIITNLIGKRASKLPKESIHELLGNTNFDEDCHNVLTSKSY